MVAPRRDAFFHERYEVDTPSLDAGDEAVGCHVRGRFGPVPPLVQRRRLSGADAAHVVGDALAAGATWCLIGRHLHLLRRHVRPADTR